MSLHQLGPVRRQHPFVAINRDLYDRVREGRFREGLYCLPHRWPGNVRKLQIK